MYIPVNEALWERVLEHCSFERMKKNGKKSAPEGGVFWDTGADVFIHKGVNDRWREVLSEEECRAYETRAVAQLCEECALWLAMGSAI